LTSCDLYIIHVDVDNNVYVEEAENKIAYDEFSKFAKYVVIISCQKLNDKEWRARVSIAALEKCHIFIIVERIVTTMYISIHMAQ